MSDENIMTLHLMRLSFTAILYIGILLYVGIQNSVQSSDKIVFYDKSQLGRPTNYLS